MKSVSRYSFDYAFRTLLMILPFMTVLSVFTREKLGLGAFSFIKEFLVISMFATVAYYHITRRQKIQWNVYDFIIGIYILILTIVTLFTTKLSGFVYGGRYDFFFFVTFFSIFHGYFLLEKSYSYYLKIFLISSSIMIFLSMLLKWPFSEDLLLYLGYSGNPSNWQFGSSVPIFHGVDGANVRRFQGLLDGPNSMGAFLIIYTGIIVYYFRQKKDWYFVTGGGVLLVAILIFFTYSRSAVIGFFGGVSIIILFLLRYLFTHYKKQFITISIIFMFAIAGVFIQYGGNMKAIIERGGSTNGHMERMKVGMNRAISSPFGQGLGSAGPAYRYVQNLENKERKDIEEMDRFYIPESWYIQQMIEGGFLGFIVFLLIMIFFAFRLYQTHIILFGMFIGISIMNLFLHTFESSVVVLSLFSLIGLILAHESSLHARK